MQRRIRIERLNWNLTTTQVLAVRVHCATDDQVEEIANRLLTEWLAQHPGICASWTLTGLSGKELGHT